MIELKNSYAQLPGRFFARIEPSSAQNPSIIAYNQELATELQIINLDDAKILKVFSGQELPKNCYPLAQAYAGHQFGNFVPQLGDGRALLIGELEKSSGQLYDIQLKGCGRTPFSRRGDGRSAIGPVIREYIVSEAMHALGVPTTRALAAVTTGESVYREKAYPGAILTRVASSHIRVGTFEYFSARNDKEAIKILTDYAIKRHSPYLADSKDKYLSFFSIVSKRQIQTVAKWMSLGFIHGVMNTDNCTISGETIDYGPCAFMDHFKFDQVYSSIDHDRRYCYKNQGNIILWNLASLANCLKDIVPWEELEEIHKKLPQYFEARWLSEMSKKFGIFKPKQSDYQLINNWLKYLNDNRLDFTNSFRQLNTLLANDNDSSIQNFKHEWIKRLEEQFETKEEAIELMNSFNPAIIPRNHLIQKAISDAEKGDYEFFHEFNSALKSPFTQMVKYESPPKPEQIVHQTFCGT